MLYRVAIFSKYCDTSIYRYVSHITSNMHNYSSLVAHFTAKLPRQNGLGQVYISSWKSHYYVCVYKVIVIPLGITTTWTDPDRHKDRIFIEKRRAVQVHLGEVVLLCLTKFFTINIHKSLNTNEGYDTFGNLVRLPRNQGKSWQKSQEIRPHVRNHNL